MSRAADAQEKIGGRMMRSSTTGRLGRQIAVALLIFGIGAGLPAEAKTFKWANAGDVSSMDPYARNETFLLTFMANIYEPLVRRDKELKLEPALATKWGQTSGSVWYLDIRDRVD